MRDLTQDNFIGIRHMPLQPLREFFTLFPYLFEAVDVCFPGLPWHLFLGPWDQVLLLHRLFWHLTNRERYQRFNKHDKDNFTRNLSIINLYKINPECDFLVFFSQQRLCDCSNWSSEGCSWKFLSIPSPSQSATKVHATQTPTPHNVSTHALGSITFILQFMISNNFQF